MSALGSGAPPWLPATVGAAARTGAAGEDDLLSGRSWERLVRSLGEVGGLLTSAQAPSRPLDRVAGYRHLLVLLALGIDEALRTSDPDEPRIAPGNVDNVLKWGMDCPDALYVGCTLRPEGVYRVHGTRGTVRYLGLQVMGGMESLANVVADDLVLDDGRLEVTLASETRPGNWMPLGPRSSSLVVRQFFYDWDTEEPAELAVERLDASRHNRSYAPDDARTVPAGAALARQVEALGEFVDASVRFWLDIEEQGRAQGLNRFREPSARTDIGGAAENVTVWGSWQLEDDEALLIEVRPPPALYWSVSLGNAWWETIDYSAHQSSLNGHQAVVDPDGVFRAVVSARDPGVANWLDTAGHGRGPMIFRWVRAESVPEATTRVVPLQGVDSLLPPQTTRVDTAARQAALARRRAGIRRRFVR